MVSKKPGNVNTTVLEVGDIVRGYWSATEFWPEAIYNGGDALQKANYTILARHNNL